MKKVLSVVVALVIALSSLAVFAFAAGTPVISIQADTSTAKVGDTVKVNVNVSEKSDICALTFHLNYDADKLELVSTAVKGGFAEPILNTNIAGKVIYAAATIDPISSDAATLLEVEFKVVKTGGKISINVIEAYVAVEGNNDGKNVTSEVAKEAAKTILEVGCAHANKTEVVIKPATCEENGIKAEECNDCDWKSENVVIPATGHAAGEWEVIKEATETETGEQVKKCTVCGEVVETEVIPMLPTYILGDVTGDGEVKGLDVRWVLQYAADMRELSEAQLVAADVNKDGEVTSFDARWMLQALAGLRKL